MTCILVGPAAGTAAAELVNTGFVEVTGHPRVGEELVCDVGSWTGVPQFTIEWRRNGVLVAGKIGNPYKVESTDAGSSITCIVIATEGEESEEEESINSLAIPGGSKSETPKDITLPHISGTPEVGQKLKCEEGQWSGSPAPKFAFQWLREGSKIESATKNEYTVASADEGTSLSCKVTASNGVGGEPSATSEKVAVPATKAPKDITKPEVLGEAVVGHELTCKPGEWEGEPTFTYQWLREGAPISGADGQTYVIVTADETHQLSCEVTATNNVKSPVKALSKNSLHVPGSPPEDKTPPRVAGPEKGQAKEGQTLKCEKGEWAGVPTPSFVYVWVRDRGLASPVAVGFEQTYEVKAADKGHTLACEVKATNEEAGFPPVTVTVASESIPVLSGQAGEPKNLELPQVKPSTSTPSVGEALTCSEGAWTGNPEISYQWVLEPGSLAEVALTPGESHYTVVAADAGHSLACKVTAKNSEGVAIVLSRTLTVPGSGPTNTEAPKLSGKAAVKETLSCSQGKWAGAPEPTYRYQWVRDYREADEATVASETKSYVVTTGDRGYKLYCVVTATNSTGSAEKATEPLHILGSAPEPIAAQPPVIVGTPTAGEGLTCETGGWEGAPTPTMFEYKWLLEGTPIPLATTRKYVVVPADQGRVLSCEVTATNAEGSNFAISKSAHVPGLAPVNTEAPQVGGSGVLGQAMNCRHGGWDGKPPPSFTYEWLRDGSTIVSATTEETYTVVEADLGHSLSCKVIATNSEGTSVATSAPFEIIGGQAAVEAKQETHVASTSSNDPAPTASAAQILSALASQLALMAHGAHIAPLLKHGYYSFPFTSLSAGKLVVDWYEVPKGAHVSSAKSKPKPVLVATVTVSFTSASKKTVKLRLTSAGRSLLKAHRSIKLTAKGVFMPSGGRSVTWLKTFVLNH